MKEFKSWHDIKDWCEENGFERMARRMQINNDCWWSSGEFGRSQVAICDAMRFAEDEDARVETAEEIEASLEGDWCLA